MIKKNSQLYKLIPDGKTVISNLKILNGEVLSVISPRFAMLAGLFHVLDGVWCELTQYENISQL